MNEFEESVQVLRRAYEAFNRRDVDAVLSMLDPEVEWPNMLDGVTAHGRGAVREYWERQFTQIDSHVDPVAFVTDGDAVVVQVQQVVRDRQGVVVREGRVAHRYTFRGQLIARMQVNPTTEDARR
jgi:ketosteroid isomerase-like protein